MSRAAPGRRGGGSRRAVLTSGGAAAAGVVGALAAFRPGAAAGLVGALILLALLLAARSHRAPVDQSGRRFGWIVAAWVFLLVQPIGHFTAGRTTLTAVHGAPSVENLLELATHGLIAAASLWTLSRGRLPWRVSGTVFALPLLAVASSAWSLAPTVTLGFSFELVAIALLATVSAAVLRQAPTVGISILVRTLRLTVLAVAGLCVLGLLFRGGWTLPGEKPRFTWPGTHPLVASADVGLALLIVLFAGRRHLRLARPSRITLITLFAACLYLGRARTALAGLILASIIGYWLATDGASRAKRLVGSVAIVLAVAFLVTSFNGALTQYLYRGQSEQQVLALNGRLGLWALAVDQLHSPGRWLVGYGLSGTRVLLADSVAWAGDAHSAWVELLLSLGLLGAVIGVGVIATVGRRLLRATWPPDHPGRVLATLFVYVLAMSPAATGFAMPGPEAGLGYAMLSLCWAATAAVESAVVTVPVRQAAGVRAAPRAASA